MTQTRVLPYVVGLTGSMASGKSTVLAQWAALGAETISADEIVRELYKTQRVRRWLGAQFGSSEPAQVARVVFRQQDLRHKLETFLHPLVWQTAQKKLAVCRKPWVVFEVPLLFEAGWNKRVSLTVLVSASPKTLPARLKARGISVAEYEQRRRTQGPEEEKIRQADLVIYNNQTKQRLCEQAERLYRAFEDLYV